MSHFLSDSQRGKYLPIQSEDFYKVILRPETEYDSVHRSLAFPRRGITYVYGEARGNVGGPQTEIIEVWFERAKWTASSVMNWMVDHQHDLPSPSGVKPPPAGSPALAKG